MLGHWICPACSYFQLASCPNSSAWEPDAPELPFVSSISMRLCSSLASAFFLSFSRARLCCRRRSLSSCCCKNNSSCQRRSYSSLRSCSFSNCRSRSCFSASFTLRFLSSISSICRLLGDWEMPILVFFRLPRAAECLNETRHSLQRFLLLQFLYQLRSLLVPHQQPMWMTLTMFDFHYPWCDCTVWSGLNSNSY